jgi:hypothetical protein
MAEERRQATTTATTMTTTNRGENNQSIFILSPVEEFIRLQNDLVELERQNERESHDYTNTGAGELIASGEQPTTQSLDPTSSRRSFIPSTPRRQRSRGGSCDGDDILSPPESVAAPTEERLLSSPSSETAPFPPIQTTPDVSSSKTAPLKEIGTTEKLSGSSPSQSVTRSRSRSSSYGHHSDSPIIISMMPPQPPPPSECSVPDYDLKTLQEARLSHDDEDPSMKSRPDSQEVAQEGLRRSVTTDNRHIPTTTPQVYPLLLLFLLLRSEIFLFWL